MSSEKEPNQEIPAENGENNEEEVVDVVKEEDVEERAEKVVPEIPSDEASPQIDQESLQEPGAGIYEAPLDPTDEE